MLKTLNISKYQWTKGRWRGKLMKVENIKE